MSYKEIDIATPTTSDLSHDETIYPSQSSDSLKQIQSSSTMSAHNLSTPISSPSGDTSILSAPKPATENVAAAPLSPSATSEKDSHPKDIVNNNDESDDDDDDDDLFNEADLSHDSSDLPAPVLSSQSNNNKLASLETLPEPETEKDPGSAGKRSADTTHDEANPTKRPKTEEEDTKVKIEEFAPRVPEIQLAVDGPLDPRDPTPGNPRILAKHQVKFALASLRAVKRLKDAAPFAEPVDAVKLNIPTYYTIITNPMDLGTIERKVQDGQYGSFTEFSADMELIVVNCVKFNGTDSFISNMARNIKASFDKHMNNMPAYELAGASSTSKAKKRSVNPPASKSQRAASTATPPPAKAVSVSPKKVARPASIKESSVPAKTLSNKSTAKLPGPATTAVRNIGKKPSPGADSQPFALQPSGMPTIRRESSAGGRPKREIHPPKPKDLLYGDVKPRKKKYANELRFCGSVLKELMSKKHEAYNFPFLQPVDPVALNCPTYFNIIKVPMDLSTIQQRFNTNHYEAADEFEADIRLMFRNCYKFNPEGSPVNSMGHTLEDLFDKKWKDLPVTPPSPPPIIVETDSEEESDISDNELIKDDPAIKYLEQQLERMQKDLEKMKKEALQKAREARDARRKSKKKKTNGSVGAAKKGGKASSVDNTGSSRRKSTAGSGTGRRTSTAGSINGGPVSSPYVTYEMKEELSRMCQNLPEKKMRHVLKLIQEGMPNFNSDDQEEVELEIDQLNPATVLKLYDYVVKSTKPPRSNPAVSKASGKSAAAAAALAAAQKRKGKPMSEAEQTQKIEELQRKLAEFDRAETVVDGEEGISGEDLMISASGAGMASAGNAGIGNAISDSSDDDDDDDSSSSEEE